SSAVFCSRSSSIIRKTTSPTSSVFVIPHSERTARASRPNVAIAQSRKPSRSSGPDTCLRPLPRREIVKSSDSSTKANASERKRSGRHVAAHRRRERREPWQGGRCAIGREARERSRGSARAIGDSIAARDEECVEDVFERLAKPLAGRHIDGLLALRGCAV